MATDALRAKLHEYEGILARIPSNTDDAEEKIAREIYETLIAELREKAVQWGAAATG
jgi:hypothetical protein